MIFSKLLPSQAIPVHFIMQLLSVDDGIAIGLL